VEVDVVEGSCKRARWTTTVPVRAATRIAQRPTNTKPADKATTSTRHNSTTMALIDDVITAYNT
jgi:hypothetical protein